MEEKAGLLRQLHRPVLVLPNAWDAASARIFERAGFPAIGTTSAGIAFALGYADGERVPRGEMVEAIARIVRAVHVPVTADLEAGYGDAERTAREVWAAGAVGMNLEDGTKEGLFDLAPVIRAVRAAVPSMVVNARTDVFWRCVGDEASRFKRAVERLNAYREAGEDCLFAPGVQDGATIARLVEAVHGPLNVLAVSGTPPVAELKRMGVARASMGSGPMRAALGLLHRIAQQLRRDGSYLAMLNGAMPYAEANSLFVDLQESSGR
jgi:2-methylisocitrate lyase-like PEP mutase family enzyme